MSWKPSHPLEPYVIPTKNMSRILDAMERMLELDVPRMFVWDQRTIDELASGRTFVWNSEWHWGKFVP